MGLFQAHPSSLEEAKVCFPEVQGRDPAFCSAPSSQNPKLHHLMVTAAKDTFNLYIPNKPFLVCKCEVQQSICPCWIVQQLGSFIMLSPLSQYISYIQQPNE